MEPPTPSDEDIPFQTVAVDVSRAFVQFGASIRAAGISFAELQKAVSAVAGRMATEEDAAFMHARSLPKAKKQVEAPRVRAIDLDGSGSL